MNELFLKIINMSISASWLVLAVLILRLVFKKTPKWINVLLWGIVAIRLICPITIESPVSLIPDSIGSGELVSEWMDDYIDDIDIYHSDSIYYDAAIGAGREPIYDGEGGYYVVTKHDQLGEPATIENAVMPILSIVWVAGITVLVLYTVISCWCLRRKVDTAVLYKDNIFQSENVSSPFVLGIIKPRIYLPFKVNGQDFEHVVAHEQAHIRRKDHWWKPLGFLLLAIHWFNPLMWLAYVLLCRDIELACDEKVIKELGNEQRANYTQALVACSVNHRMIAACPLAFGEVALKERVKSIMNYKKPAFLIVVLAIITCIVVAFCFLTNPIRGNDDTQQDKYYLLIGTEGVLDIKVSTPNTSGGCRNADNSPFNKGEKVWLEQLNSNSDLRGVTITAFNTEGNVVYTFAVPVNATDDEITKLVSGDSWLIAPTTTAGIQISDSGETRDLIPMVMVNGILYLDTGYESTIEARCGVMDGEITSQVDGSKKPSVDDQSNFGTGYGYQYGATEGTIELYMEGKWWIFATEEARQEIQFPTTEANKWSFTDVDSIQVINGNNGERVTFAKATTKPDFQKILDLCQNLEKTTDTEENSRVGYNYCVVLYDDNGKKLHSITPYKDGYTVDDIFYKYSDVDTNRYDNASVKLLDYLGLLFYPAESESS